MAALTELSITEAKKGLSAGDFSAVELVEETIATIKKKNDTLNAFISFDEEQAHDAAHKADLVLAAGEGGALTGIPFSAKDAICTDGMRATGGGKILDTYTPPFDATVIANIKKEGAVLVGKNNCDAFGHGASNEHSMYGPVKNPHDETKVAGGSSGGSAAAVAAHMSTFSIAEDTGGSIRQPASLCGIVGLRPSYGRNSRYGIMPMASSLDTVGPMARTVEDIALLMETMAGHDPKDATTVSNAVPRYTEEIKKSVKGMRIGIPKEFFELEGLEEETKLRVEEQIKKLESLGCTLHDVSLPHTKYAIPVYYIVVPSEDSSNLGRLDGIRYGVRADGQALQDIYASSRANGFPEEVKRRIMIGTYALSAGYYDAYYRKAQRVRTLICQDFADAYKEVDALVAPTSPFPAFGIGEFKDDVIQMYLADVCVSPAAVAGVPAISIPAGNTSAGLPVGFQIMGPRLAEGRVMQLGYHLYDKQ